MQRTITRAEPASREPTEEQRADPLFVRSVEKAMNVLSAFHHADGPLSLSEIAERAGVDRSGAQRMVHTLRSLGYIRRDRLDNGFLPGLRVLDHTLDTLRLDPLVRFATPILIELRKSVRERVDLSLFDDLRLIYALRLQTKRESFYATLLGHSVPTFCSSGGWAIMSKLPTDQARDLIARSDRRPFTPDTFSTIEEIMEKVEETRSNGFSLALNQIVTGEIVTGFPVTDTNGQPVGAIHIAGSLSEWAAEDFVKHVMPLGQEAARAVSYF